MSVGEKTESVSPRRSCNSHALHINVKDGKRRKKLDIESCDEVYYPTVSIIRPAELRSTYLEGKQAKAEEIRQTTAVGVEQPVPTVNTRIKRGALKIWWSRLGTIVTTAIALIAIVAIGARIFGFRTFTVMSGSMSPEYPVGAMIYVRPVDYRGLKAGDVISYVADNNKTVVTHRIVDVEVDEKDSSVYRFRTKGDANSSADSNLVHYNNVLGTPVITIPLIGYIVHNVQQPPGIYIMLVVGTLLLAWTFLPGTLEERRKTARKSVA